MLISETFVNSDKGIQFSSSDPYEPFTQDVGKLFKALQRSHGRCTSSVYVDGKDGKTKRIGWVFQKRDRYGDTREYYLKETWITLYESPATVVQNYKTI